MRRFKYINIGVSWTFEIKGGKSPPPMSMYILRAYKWSECSPPRTYILFGYCTIILRFIFRVSETGSKWFHCYVQCVYVRTTHTGRNLSKNMLEIFFRSLAYITTFNFVIKLEEKVRWQLLMFSKVINHGKYH